MYELTGPALRAIPEAQDNHMRHLTRHLGPSSTKPHLILYRICTACLLWLCLPPGTAMTEVGTAWLKFHDGGLIPAGDWAVDMAIDASGNVYATGRGSAAGNSWEVISYTADGARRWLLQHGSGTPHVMALDASYLYVAGRGSIDSVAGFLTRKYDFDGNLIWERTYDMPNDWWFDVATQISIGPDGDVCVAGQNEFIEPWQFNAGVVVYDQDGTQKWDALYAGPDGPGYWSGPYTTSAIVSDPEGNVYVSGAWGPFLHKYDSTGLLLWEFDTGAETGSILNPGTDLQLEPGGDLYAFGRKWDAALNIESFCTVRLGPGGDTVWTRAFTDSTYPYADPVQIELDGSGNVYCLANKPGHHGAMVLKYAPDGDLIWTAEYAGDPTSTYLQPAHMFVDSVGQVFVTGFNAWVEVTGTWRMITWKLDTDGTRVWSRQVLGPRPGPDQGFAIAVTPDERIHVHGNIYREGTWDTGPYLDLGTITYVPCPTPVLGDPLGDGVVSSADIVHLVNFMFKGQPLATPCHAVGDINCDGDATSADLIHLVSYIFKSGDAPCDVCGLLDEGRGCP